MCGMCADRNGIAKQTVTVCTADVHVKKEKQLLPYLLRKCQDRQTEYYNKETLFCAVWITLNKPGRQEGLPDTR